MFINLDDAEMVRNLEEVFGGSSEGGNLTLPAAFFDKTSTSSNAPSVQVFPESYRIMFQKIALKKQFIRHFQQRQIRPTIDSVVGRRSNRTLSFFVVSKMKIGKFGHILMYKMSL